MGGMEFTVTVDPSVTGTFSICLLHEMISKKLKLTNSREVAFVITGSLGDKVDLQGGGKLYPICVNFELRGTSAYSETIRSWKPGRRFLKSNLGVRPAIFFESF